MSLNLSNIKWIWVIVGVVIAMVIAVASSLCVVTFYAGFLGVQTQGAPNTATINDFANNYAGIITSIFLGIGTLIGGALAGRRAATDAVQNGLMVGLLTAILNLLLLAFGGFSLVGILSLILVVGGGWLGGILSDRDSDLDPDPPAE